ncbi:MAG: SPOR domain-containing protein [Candidatus Koribacter versatilis]|uniref:SPOR domain-containing protein n=1 Tax=Candidatus Korobacter versatilis TaxID=658062 RepID=A0A932ENR6_9BACT|nr:SPOR domain-containing protein [Candidatus Koribacter versatilis]
MTEWNDERTPHHEPESGGTGRVLFYFFGAVVLCAVALAIGYTLGRRSVPAPTAETGAPVSTVAGSGAAKPAPARPAETPAETSAEETPASSASAMPMSTKEPKAAASKSGAAKPAPEMAAAGKGGFMVQVAAVSRQEDADALAGALRKKQYPVFVMPGTGTDKLLHVQVGPFAELKDAEAMKSKLAADGYNAIVKK